MPLCRNCRQSYVFRGDPESAGDSRKWADPERLCGPCLRAGRKRKRDREPQSVPELTGALRMTLRD